MAKKQIISLMLSDEMLEYIKDKQKEFYDKNYFKISRTAYIEKCIRADMKANNYQLKPIKKDE
jgi:hypothetical protein